VVSSKSSQSNLSQVDDAVPDLQVTQRLDLSFGVILLTCLVLSDHFHLETKAPVVELLFHPETYSSGVL
jgi:hypothetical protein